MKRVTNMQRPAMPFDHPPRSTEPQMRTVASISLTRNGVGLVYLSLDPEHPCNLDGAAPLTFDYEVLRRDDGGQQFAAVVDERMAQWDIHADVITGHDVASILETLEHGAERPDELGLRAWLLQWPMRADDLREGELAWMVDTAHDLECSNADLLRTCAAAHLRSWYLASDGETLRLPITAALASAVLVGRSMGWCAWTELDLDALVTVASAGQL